MTAAAAALEQAAQAGIHCLPIPTPFAVGRVNTYLIEDRPLTLVDSGPNSGKALDALERALHARGHAIEELGLILVTHQHMDHTGLVSILARRSGADVASIDRLAPFLESYGSANDADDAFAERLMLRHGIPADVVRALRSVSQAFRAWGSSAKVNRPLADGEVITLRDRRLHVFHRPGHSPSDTVFWDEDRRILIAADHLIGHISSNPLVTRPLEGDPPPGDRPRALMTYLNSLRKTRQLPAQLVLSGHGDPITDHVTLIEERFAMHKRRAEKIYSLLLGRSHTAYEIAQALWGNVAVTQAYLTLSEVLGHVDLLVASRQVREEDEHGVVRFVAQARPGA